MKKQFILGLLLAGICLNLPAFSQESHSTPAPVNGQVFLKKLPADLPQEKLLFIKYLPVELPPGNPKGWGNERRNYYLKKQHNESIGEANKQLKEAATRYPYAHRITTEDSIAYYRDRQGYRYMLMQSSFNSAINGSFQGTRGNTTSVGGTSTQTYTSTSVDLYVQDIRNNDKYIFDDFSETFIYYYKGQVEKLLKKIAKQFQVKN